jgi:hypothetical protein
MNYVSQLNAAWEKIERDNIKPTSVVVYFALLQINNLSHWKPVFNATFGQVLNMTGIGNVKTYYSALEELVIKHYIIWNKSRNQYQAATFTIIVLYQKTEEQDHNALPKNGSAMDQHTEEQWVSTRKSKGNILKQENPKPKNTTKGDDDLFDEFWNLYNKKTGKEKVRTRWSKLSESEQLAIIKALPGYIQTTPELKFRKDPLTYLNGRHWEDELITESKEPAASTGFVLAQKPIGYTKHS